MWRELFDESAFIFGIDVNPDVPKFTRDAHMKVLVLDSTDPDRSGQSLVVFCPESSLARGTAIWNR